MYICIYISLNYFLKSCSKTEPVQNLELQISCYPYIHIYIYIYIFILCKFLKIF